MITKTMYSLSFHQDSVLATHPQCYVIHCRYQSTKKFNNRLSKDSRTVVTIVAVAIWVLW